MVQVFSLFYETANRCRRSITACSRLIIQPAIIVLNMSTNRSSTVIPIDSLAAAAKSKSASIFFFCFYCIVTIHRSLIGCCMLMTNLQFK